MELNWQIRPRRTGRRVGLGSNDDAIKNAAKEEAKMNGIVSAREGRRQLGISHTG